MQGPGRRAGRIEDPGIKYPAGKPSILISFVKILCFSYLKEHAGNTTVNMRAEQGETVTGEEGRESNCLLSIPYADSSFRLYWGCFVVGYWVEGFPCPRKLEILYRFLCTMRNKSILKSFQENADVQISITHPEVENN